MAFSTNTSIDFSTSTGYTFDAAEFAISGGEGTLDASELGPTTCITPAIDTSTWSVINRVAIDDEVASSYRHKYLVSFDGGASWQRYQQGIWITASIGDIATIGMTRWQVEAIRDWSPLEDSLSFAVSASRTNLSHAGAISGFSVYYLLDTSASANVSFYGDDTTVGQGFVVFVDSVASFTVGDMVTFSGITEGGGLLNGSVYEITGFDDYFGQPVVYLDGASTILEADTPSGGTMDLLTNPEPVAVPNAEPFPEPAESLEADLDIQPDFPIKLNFAWPSDIQTMVGNYQVAVQLAQTYRLVIETVWSGIDGTDRDAVLAFIEAHYETPFLWQTCPLHSSAPYPAFLFLEEPRVVQIGPDVWRVASRIIQVFYEPEE